MLGDIDIDGGGREKDMERKRDKLFHIMNISVFHLNRCIDFNVSTKKY